MYRQNYETYLIEIFSNILHFELSKGIHLLVLEEKLASSRFIHALENDDDSFFDRYNKKQIIEDTIERVVNIEDIDVVSDEAYWIASAYYYLFLKYRKSFYALFLTLPISLMLHFFPTLHIVGWSHLYCEYEKVNLESTLLKRILKRRMMTMKELSLKSGVGFDSIDRYSRKDIFLYKASFSNIYKLAKALDVPFSFFVEKIEFKDDRKEEVSDLDKVLAEFIVAYYFKDIDIKDLLVVTKETKEVEIDNKKDKVLVFYQLNPESNKDFGEYKDVIIISDKKIHRHSNQITKSISDKAKSKINKKILY